ncbi:MAG: LL-diaminopimelate aminotransferase [Candidatus Omnitrophota bacterium]|nr:MAG: LL-diaminopimelate aminotransferase [Candidatus Omnitrophota bacterium]
MRIEKAERLKKLPPYLFAKIDKAKREAQNEGRDIIDLGVGDPDQPTPSHIVDKLHQAAGEPANQHYALDQGMRDLRVAIASWYRKRFNVELDADKEILPLIGSKEGLAHLPLALINPNDVVLIPEPCYPPYRSATIFAGGRPKYLPLLEEKGFLPQLDKINFRILAKAKLLFLNYPNNPTAAVAESDFFARAVKFARKNKILIAQDAAYSEITFDNYTAPSILQIKGAKDLAVEFHSLSKTYNMTGWRVGWVCGNRDIIAHLTQLKSNIDSGIFQAIQVAAICALNTGPKHLDSLRKLYQDRRDVLCAGLNSLGWKVDKPRATFYVWARLPKKYSDSIKFARLLLDKANVIATPGVGFGPSGNNYIRFALTVPRERLEQASAKIKEII